MEQRIDTSRKITKALQTFELYLGVACLFVMLVVMILNIFFRYVLYRPIAWSDELSNYLFIWMSFLASSYVMGNDGHVRVTAIESRLPPVPRRILHLVMNCVALGMFALYIVPSLRMLGKLKNSNMLRVPLKYVYLIIPISFFLMCVHIAMNIVQDLRLLRHGESVPDDALPVAAAESASK